MYDTWQKDLAHCITDPKQLFELLNLEINPKLNLNSKFKFKFKVTKSFAKRMQKGNLNDPLLKQVLISSEEQLATNGYSADPLQELNTSPVPGLLHKYKSRVLITLTGSCAIACRYCFRREFPYSEHIGSKNFKEILIYINKNTDIFEVILSGGDPLVASDSFLQNVIQQLAKIEHLTTLRIHSRLPIVLPQRITKELITCINSTRLKPILVLHCNHPQEINHEVIKICQDMQNANITLLNQAVLLKDINNSVYILKTLSKKLFASGVLPYYLHLLDKINGSQHFAVDKEIAIKLMRQLLSELPGYLVPKLVQELPKKSSKTPIDLACN